MIKTDIQHKNEVQLLKELYINIKPRIEKRLEEFVKTGKTADDEQLFAELLFCLFTPQSSAKRCWESVCRIRDNGLLNGSGTDEDIYPLMKGVRFHITKTKRFHEARELFFGEGTSLTLFEIIRNMKPFELRKWLVDHVKGLSLKEASHFMRNIGLGERLAIIDRHILRAMDDLGLLQEIPKNISNSRYLKLESILNDFSIHEEIPLDHLDLLFWYRAKGEIYK